MSRDTDRAASIVLIALVALLVLSKWDFHTGSGDELSNKNNGFNVSISLFGDSSIDAKQDGARK